jgi:DNA-binding transcriptional MerR regulator
MASHHDLPLFNLKAVVTETGLKPDTLRAWERRYGIPAPKRTPSGHRLYSQSDIDLLHWLIARQAEGLSISRAVEMWEQLQQDALRSPAAPAATDAVQPLFSQPAAHEHDDMLRSARARWVEACLRFDEQAAEQALSESFALFTPEMVCLEIIQKGLAEIGEGWYKGKVTVQQEHFASSLALRRLEAMLVATPPPTRAGRILIGCPPEEEHTFVPLLLSLLLRRHGWDTVYLGANVPLVSLERTIAATRPQLVVLTAQQLATAAGLLEMANILVDERIQVAYGGLIFNRLPELQRIIPGAFLGSRIDAAIATIKRLMASPHPFPLQRAKANDFDAALVHYREHQSEVEAEVWRLMHNHAISHRMLTAANLHFGRNIEASLLLGSMDFLGADLEWLEGLLINHVGMPSERVDEYLIVYLAAARTVLDDRAAPLTEWLARLVDGTAPPGSSGHFGTGKAPAHRSALTRTRR